MSCLGRFVIKFTRIFHNMTSSDILTITHYICFEGCVIHLLAEALVIYVVMHITTLFSIERLE